MPCSLSRDSNHPSVNLSVEFQSSDIEAGDLKTSEMRSFSREADRTSGRASCILSNSDAVVDSSSPGESEIFFSSYCKFVVRSMLYACWLSLTLVGWSCYP